MQREQSTGGLPRERIVNVGRDVLKAVKMVHEELGPGDVVLIKGRGHQRLDRVVLALIGRTVRCHMSYCNAELRREYCPMLERGWEGLKVII